MPFRPYHLLACLAPVILSAPIALADNAPLESKLQAFEVVSKEDGGETYVPAERIDPGSVIEYRLIYTNVSDAALDKLVLDAAVPEASRYESHVSQVGQPSVVEARTSDIDWTRPPLVRMIADEAGVVRPVEVSPAEYEGLRWRLASPLAAGEQVEARYRVRVDN